MSTYTENSERHNLFLIHHPGPQNLAESLLKSLASSRGKILEIFNKTGYLAQSFQSTCKFPTQM